MAVKIGTRLIGDGYPCLVVAEIGINHNGSRGLAFKLIDAACDAHCDAVKFQKRDVGVVYSSEALAQPRKFDRSILENAFAREKVEGVEYQVFPTENRQRLKSGESTTNGDLKWALELHHKDYDLIRMYCEERNMLWFASCWDGLSVNFMDGLRVPCHKIASACLTHADLLKRVREHGKPVILSTGGSTIEQIAQAVDIVGRENLILLHCVATYPAAEEDLNLSLVDTLRSNFRGIPVGYSGHEQDVFPSVLSVAMGACVVERHITLDRKMPGTDHAASLEPNEFKRLVEEIRRAERIRGSTIKRVLPAEVPVMEKLRRVKNFER